MYTLSPEAIAAIQPELISGESIVWAGRPNPRILFHREDAYLIPFSLFWGGFSIFWEMGVMGLGPFGTQGGQPWAFGEIWGIPLVLIGQYLIWGRFLFSRWKKGQIYYAVTNRRVIAVQTAPQRKLSSAYLDTLPNLMKSVRNDGIGTVTFAQVQSPWLRQRGWGAWDPLNVGDIPSFVDINDSSAVYQLIADLREKARTTRAF